MLRWCESHQVDYIVGIAKNERLKALSAKLEQRAERKHRKSGEKVRLFKQFKYRAGSWDKKRRIIAKAEHTALGVNPRFVVTNLAGGAQMLYEEIYCARGEMENRIKRTTARTLQRSDQPSLLVAQPVPAAALQLRLRVIGSLASAWPQIH